MSGVGANTIATRFDVSLQAVKRHRATGYVERSIKGFAVAIPEAKAVALGEQAAHNAESLIAKSATPAAAACTWTALQAARSNTCSIA